MNKRDDSIDMLRAISVLYIVGYWHMFNYTQAFPEYNNEVTVRVTVIILGLFVFLSGFLLGRRNVNFNLTDFIWFYKKRIIRIYPLYVGALTLFLFYGLCDRSVWAKGVLSISMFYGPPPPTLWFITMILFFYLVAPFLIATTRSTAKYVLLASSILTTLFCAYMISPTADPRVVIYFPAFALGIYFSNRDKQVKLSMITSITLSSLVISFFFSTAPEASFASIPIASIIPFAIFSAFKGRLKNTAMRSLFGKLSYAGFIMYLIHRPIYLTMKNIYFPSELWMQVLYLVLICLPVIFGISWLLQKSYDLLLEIVLSRMVGTK